MIDRFGKQIVSPLDQLFGDNMKTDNDKSSNLVERLVGRPCGELKLYVVGDTSSDPSKWSSYGGWGLVFADSPDQAIAIADKDDLWSPYATEIKPIVPCLIHHEW